MAAAPEAPAARAHGKAILIGEHAVVHGTAAIAMPIGLGLVVELGTEPAPGLPAAFIDWFRALAQARCGDAWVPAAIGGDLPRGVGLGSSAALAVAALRAIPAPWTSEGLRRAADEAEAIFHGNPSGLDVRTVLSDRPILFRRGAPGAPAGLPVGRALALELWVSEPGPPTAELVAAVSAALDAGGKAKAIEDAAALVERARRALAAGDVPALGNAMTDFHAWLRTYGASTPRLDELVDRAVAAGAAGAKLSGAGGGGAVLVLWGAAGAAAPALPPGVARYGFVLPAT